MGQPSLKIPDIIADAAFPQNAKGVLRFSQMNRILRQMHFDKNDINEYNVKLRTSVYMVLAEQFGTVSHEKGGNVYNCEDVIFDFNEQSLNGVQALSKDAVARGRHQLFMDSPDFSKRLREKFIEMLRSNQQSDEKESVMEPLPASPPPAATKRPRLFLIRKEELASPGINM
ncbi:MAG: hypothetical protein DYH13_08240 [Alphaproteobacteria bacterium PRO2]|nr:hypothetical protein [Alphaproteobacteria bacterium PRO2]